MFFKQFHSYNGDPNIDEKKLSENIQALTTAIEKLNEILTKIHTLEIEKWKHRP
jgi:hypothetical protein